MSWDEDVVCDVDKQVGLGELFQLVQVRHCDNNLCKNRSLRGAKGDFATGWRTLRAEGVMFPGKMMIPLGMLFSSRMLSSLGKSLSLILVRTDVQRTFSSS